MTTFALIDPKAHKIECVECLDYKEAVSKAGLSGLDFGTVAKCADGRVLSIIVYEWSLMKDAPPSYFALNGRLYNGNAVLFMTDEEGKTIDFPNNLAKHLATECSYLQWLDSIEAVEEAISAQKVTRPQMAINGQVYWEWNREDRRN